MWRNPTPAGAPHRSGSTPSDDSRLALREVEAGPYTRPRMARKRVFQAVERSAPAKLRRARRSETPIVPTGESPRRKDPPLAHEPEQSLGATPLPRQRVSDQVFERLVSAILKGELKPGEPLATQRELATEFGVSPLLVRQAIHRLEELDLVRVRQGSTTIVLDPSESNDIRVLQHRVEAAAAEPTLVAAVLEVHLLGALPLLVLAERCITEAELQELSDLTDALSEDATPAETQRFMAAYWLLVAEATRNPYFQHQTRWWWSLSNDLRRRDIGVPLPTHAAMLRRDYQKITRALAARSGSTQAYLEALRQLLGWLDYMRNASAAGRAALARDQPAPGKRTRSRKATATTKAKR
jgi:DNA-binding FadR family transcriptional regulator